MVDSNELSINAQRVLRYLHDSEHESLHRTWTGIVQATGIDTSHLREALEILTERELIRLHGDGYYNLTAVGWEWVQRAQRRGDSIFVAGDVGPGAVVGPGSVQAGTIAGGKIIQSSSRRQDSEGDEFLKQAESLVENHLTSNETETILRNRTQVPSNTQSEEVQVMTGLGNIIYYDRWGSPLVETPDLITHRDIEREFRPLLKAQQVLSDRLRVFQDSPASIEYSHCLETENAVQAIEKDIAKLKNLVNVFSEENPEVRNAKWALQDSLHSAQSDIQTLLEHLHDMSEVRYWKDRQGKSQGERILKAFEDLLRSTEMVHDDIVNLTQALLKPG